MITHVKKRVLTNFCQKEKMRLHFFVDLLLRNDVKFDEEFKLLPVYSDTKQFKNWWVVTNDHKKILRDDLIKMYNDEYRAEEYDRSVASGYIDYFLGKENIKKLVKVYLERNAKTKQIVYQVVVYDKRNTPETEIYVPLQTLDKQRIVMLGDNTKYSKSILNKLYLALIDERVTLIYNDMKTDTYYSDAEDADEED